MRLRLEISMVMVTILVTSFAGRPAAAGTDYFTTTPCRWVDTRTTAGPSLAPGESRTFYVGGACGVPVWARGVSLNVVAIVATPASSGSLFLYPAGSSPKFPICITPCSASSLIPLAADGSTGMTALNDSTGAVHLVIDLNGYFMRTNCIEPPPGMAAWWPFDETAGTVAVDLAGGHDGSYLKSPATVAGMVDQARFFGPGQSVEVADSNGLDFGIGDFSFDAWLMTSRSDSVVYVILDKREYSAGTYGYHVFLYQGRLCLQLSDGDFTNYCSAAFVADGAWHHVAITVQRRAPDGIRWYRDGTEVMPRRNPTLHQGSLDNSSPLSLAVRSAALGGGDNFQGALDEVELFPRVLSVPEIRALWEAGAGGKCR